MSVAKNGESRDGSPGATGAGMGPMTIGFGTEEGGDDVHAGLRACRTAKHVSITMATRAVRKRMRMVAPPPTMLLAPAVITNRSGLDCRLNLPCPV